MTRIRLGPLVACVPLLVASGAWAQTNLLVNPSFDQDLAGWDLPIPPSGAQSDAMDVAGSQTSGSAKLMNASSIVGEVVSLSQCVRVVASTLYDFGGSIYRVDGFVASGGITLEWFSGPNCVGFIDDVGASSGLNPGEWSEEEFLSQTAPANAVTARFNATSKKTAETGIGTVFFDDLFLLPEPISSLLQAAALATLALLAAFKHDRTVRIEDTQE